MKNAIPEASRMCLDQSRTNPMKKSFLMLFLLVFFACDLEEIPSVTVRPKACFTFDLPSDPCLSDCTVAFDATCSEAAADYNWDFGDGNMASGAKPSHAYSRPGNYLVKLTISGAATQQIDTITKTVTIEGGDTFMRTYDGGNGDDRGFSVIATRNGGYAITGGSSNGINQDVLLILTDQYGNTQSGTPKRFNLSNNDHAGRIIIQRSNGNILIGGDANGTAGWLIKADENGEELNDSPKFFQDQIFSLGVTQVGNDLFVLTGLGSGPNSTDLDLAVVLFDGQGIEYGASPIFISVGEFFDYGFSVIATPNGGLAIAGSSINEQSTSSNMWLVLLDNNLEQLSNSPVFFNDINVDKYGGSVILTEAGILAILGVSAFVDPPTTWIFFTDENGNELLSPVEFSGISGVSLIKRTGGGYAFLGNSVAVGSLAVCKLIVLDANFNEVTSSPKLFQGVTGEQLIQAPDGGFVIVGSKSNGTNSDVVLIKTDPEGNVDQ